jgi:hypothetical protein
MAKTRARAQRPGRWLVGKVGLGNGRRLTLLSSAQLLNTLLVVMFTVETDADSHTYIILNTVPSLIIGVFVFSLASISSSLDHETATTGWDKSLEDGSEFLGDLLESSLNSFVFTLIEDLNELLNG